MDINADSYGRQETGGANDSGLTEDQQKVFNAFNQGTLQGLEEGNSVEQVSSRLPVLVRSVMLIIPARSLP
jgi:hypothetical protein